MEEDEPTATPVSSYLKSLSSEIAKEPEPLRDAQTVVGKIEQEVKVVDTPELKKKSGVKGEPEAK